MGCKIPLASVSLPLRGAQCCRRRRDRTPFCAVGKGGGERFARLRELWLFRGGYQLVEGRGEVGSRYEDPVALERFGGEIPTGRRRRRVN
jgi:hypothetical protein